MKGKRSNMEDCLHTSSDNLAKLVKWAHSHGTICTLIPNLKHMINEGSHGALTAMWGCSAGHAYHWPLSYACKTGTKECMCHPESRTLNPDCIIPANSSAERFLGNTAKRKGNSSQADSSLVQNSCDLSNGSEPSELEDNAEEYSSNLYDIVCESSASEEDADSDFTHTQSSLLRKRPGRGPVDNTDPALKKIKQERGEDFYIVANPQMPGVSDGHRSTVSTTQSPKAHISPSARTSFPQKPSISDTDLIETSTIAHPNTSTSTIKPLCPSLEVSPIKAHGNCNPACSPGYSSGTSGRIDAMGVLHRDPYPRSSYGEAALGINPEMDLLSSQVLSNEARDNPGSHEKMDYAVILKALHEHLIPATHGAEEAFCPSDLSPNGNVKYLEERKHLEDFITSIDTVTLQNLQAVIDRILVFHERTQMPLSSPARQGEQELITGSGLYLPQYKLASMLQESRQDSMKLFHLLFEHFFSEEDLNGAVAFGKRGKVPDGKKILDRRRVDGILSYVLRCSTLNGWTPVESSKLKKACINKCRLRIGQKKKLESSQESFMFCHEQSVKNESSYM